MEVGSRQNPPRLQRTSCSLCMTAVITRYSQTELAINTHVTVSSTHTVVANTHSVVSNTNATVSNTHAMVSDIHRTIVHGQEGGDGKPSVSGIRAPAVTK